MAADFFARVRDLIADAAKAPKSRVVPTASSGMVAALKLEALGDGYRRLARDKVRALGMLHRVPHAHRLRLLDGAGPWVARIAGRDPKYGLVREFVRPLRDYRDASKSGNTGIILVYMLPEGFYEVHAWESWSRERRYFVRSASGKLAEMTPEEVDRCLP